MNIKGSIDSFMESKNFAFFWESNFLPTLTLCKASWKTTDVGVVSGNTGVNAQPVWSQMQL